MRSAYGSILNCALGEQVETYEKLWAVILFGWRVIINRLQTKENLFRRSIMLVDTNYSCSFYGLMAETTDHLLYNNLLQDLNRVKIHLNVKDAWRWLPSSDGDYSVRTAYKVQA